MKTTRYFEEQVLRKRPYLRREWCLSALASPVAHVVQIDGRQRFWIQVESDDGVQRMLRVVTLEDGETIHNAFFDRSFRKSEI